MRFLCLDLKIDAAFVGNDKFVYLFSGKNYTTVAKKDLTPTALEIIISKPLALTPTTPIHEKWGKTETSTVLNGVDAAFYDGSKTFLIKGNEYVAYSGDYDFIDQGYPKKLKANPDGLP